METIPNRGLMLCLPQPPFWNGLLQGCAKVPFRTYQTPPQKEKKGVVPVLRRAQNRHNTLFLILGVVGYDLKGTFAQP